MSESSSTSEAVPVHPGRFGNLKIAFGIRSDPAGRPPFIWAERWNAPILMTLIAIGTPLMGWSEMSLDTKKLIKDIWQNMFLVYLLLEGREILGQMEGRGTISAPQARRQVRTAQLPHIGTLIAVFIWILALAYFRNEPGGSPIRYGTVEWGLIWFNFFGVFISNYLFNGMILELSKSAPRGERSEQRLPRHE